MSIELIHFKRCGLPMFRMPPSCPHSPVLHKRAEAEPVITALHCSPYMEHWWSLTLFLNLAQVQHHAGNPQAVVRDLMCDNPNLRCLVLPESLNLLELSDLVASSTSNSGNSVSWLPSSLTHLALPSLEPLIEEDCCMFAKLSQLTALHLPPFLQVRSCLEWD